MWVVELLPFSTHNALRAYTCSKKKFHHPLSAVNLPMRVCESFHFFLESGSVRSRCCLHPASLSLSLSPLYTSKETWEHESVVLTTTYAHTPNPYIQLTIIENKSPAVLSKAAKKKYHIAHTRCARRGRERRERREREEGEGGEAKKQNEKENCSNQDSRVVPHRSTN